MLSTGTRYFQHSIRWLGAVAPLALAALGWMWIHHSSRTSSAPTSHAKPPLAAAPAVTPEQQARVLSSFGNLPLAFEPNRGQTDPVVKYLSRNAHYNLFLTSNEAVFAMPVPAKDEPSRRRHRTWNPRPKPESVLRLSLLGANHSPTVKAETQISGHSNYLIGNDPSKWVRDVEQFARVNYSNLYPGIDLTFYGQQRQLEFDFIVQPGADPQKIAMGVTGANSMRTDSAGDLVLASAAGDLRLHKPLAYQKQGDTRQPVDARFVVHDREVVFALGPYDHSRELVIDPSILYSTYIGAGAEDDGYAIAVDSTGAAYITGQTASPGFPGAAHGGGLTPGGLDLGTAGASKSDAFVVKLSPDGTSLVYSVFLGGTGTDSGNAIVLDTLKQAYVVGTTDSSDFPAAGNPQPSNGGGNSDAFVAVLNAAGNSLVFSSYIGGSGDDVGYGVAQDPTGIYVVGSTTSSDFPAPNNGILKSSYQGNSDGFVTKIDSVGGTFLNSGYLGGTGADIATGVAVDGSQNVFVTGVTVSPDFPHVGTATYPNAHQCGTDGNCNAGKDDSFVTEIKSDFTAYIYSNFLGGSSFDDANQIVLDSSGNAYVVGITSSTDFPTKNPFQASLGAGSGVSNAYITKFDNTGNQVFSTYLGGGGTDNALSVALDGSTNVYVTGSTTSTNFPLMSATQTALGGNKDAFVSELKSDGSALLFSTYLGGHAEEDHFLAGIAVDGNNNIYVTGDTLSVDFPVTGNAPKTTYTNSCGATNPCRDAFVVKYAPGAPAFTVSVGAISPAAVSRGSSGTSTVTVSSTGATGTVNLVCNIITAAATPPTCSLGAGSVAITGGGAPQTTTLTINTVKTAAAPFLPSALWLPLPALPLLGVGFLPAKNRARRLLLSVAGCLALASLLLMAGCGSGNGGGGGGGGGGTTTGSYTVTVTGTITNLGSSSGSANFSVQ